MMLLIGVAALMPEWLPIAAAAADLEQLLETGTAAMADGDAGTALAAFSEATMANPGDAEAHFFRGAALNRLGRFADSVVELDEARRLRGTHPDLDFERGWALMGAGRWSEAISALESVEKHTPGRGQTSEFLGRCLLALGDARGAEARFAEALSRDPSLADTVSAARAMMEEAPGARAAFTAPETFSLHGGITLAAGHNTNILGLNSDAEKLPGFPGLEATFVIAAADARAEWQAGEATVIGLKGGLQWIAYDEISEADVLEVSAGFDVRHALDERWLARLQLDFDHAQLGGRAFRSTWQARPSVTWRQSAHHATELGLGVSIADYYFDLPAPLDRDALSYAVDLTHHIALMDGRLRGFASAFARRDDAAGREFDARFLGVRAGLAARLPWRLEAEAAYTGLCDRYDNASLLTPLADTRRRGWTHLVALQLNRPIAAGVSAFVRYSFQIADSSVPFYEYDQHLWMAGLRWEF